MKKIVFVLFMFFCLLCVINAENIEPGDEVTYNNIGFYVLSVNDNYYTLIKSRPFTMEEINQYGVGHINNYVLIAEYGPEGRVEKTKMAINYNGYGRVVYYSSPTCTNISNYDTSGCKSNYESSEIKYIVDNWASKSINSNDLVKDKLGYTARLITLDEVRDNLKFEYKQTGISSMGYKLSKLSPHWIMNSISSFWTMTPFEDSNDVYAVNSGVLDKSTAIQDFPVTPVINVKKEKVALVRKDFNNLKEKNLVENKSYKRGDTLIYNGIKFYVLKDSSIDADTVTLLKAEPLSQEELEMSGVANINKHARVISNLSSGPYIAYYSSETCGEKDNSSIYSGCTVDYSKSEIKYIVDNWGKKYLNSEDLVIDSNGYSVRLLNKEDIINDLYYIGYQNQQITFGSIYFISTDNTPNYNISNCWTMSSVEDSNVFMLHNSNNRYFYVAAVYEKIGTVCPVVTLKKQDVIEENMVIDVADTSNNINVFLIVIGIIIVSVSSILIYLKIKKK